MVDDGPEVRRDASCEDDIEDDDDEDDDSDGDSTWVFTVDDDDDSSDTDGDRVVAAAVVVLLPAAVVGGEDDDECEAKEVAESESERPAASNGCRCAFRSAAGDEGADMAAAAAAAAAEAAAEKALSSTRLGMLCAEWTCDCGLPWPPFLCLLSLSCEIGENENSTGCELVVATAAAAAAAVDDDDEEDTDAAAVTVAVAAAVPDVAAAVDAAVGFDLECNRFAAASPDDAGCPLLLPVEEVEEVDSLLLPAGTPIEVFLGFWVDVRSESGSESFFFFFFFKKKKEEW